jgi:hypothetical protein
VERIAPIVSWTLLGILLMPSPRILDPERTHKRHATCEHHLRRHHPDPAERAKVLRRAERRKRRLEERARIEQERALAQEAGEDRVLMAETLDGSSLQLCQAAADTQDDDSRMKKRRHAKLKSLFWSLQQPPRIRPGGDFLAMLRVHLEKEHPRPAGKAETLEHYGSGPCHSIPRPREGTIPRDPPGRGVVA